MSKKVAVAMSGGIDSSVTAALLKERGFELVGLTMQMRDAASNAKKIADKLGIPHYTLNLRDIFREQVIANFCEEYARGRTPNPCIRCNRYIKFGALLQKAKEMGASFIATGHYARIEYSKEKKKYILKKAVDPQKDQSYFLYTMTQDQLKHTLTPLGEFTKNDIKKKAQELGLTIAGKNESQEICFIPNNNYVEFLKNYIPEAFRAGPILNKKGDIIGEHKGIPCYTIGQREGLGISHKEPLYIIAIDHRKNALVVGKKKETYQTEVYAGNINYIGLKNLTSPFKVKAKVRYLHKESEAVIEPLNNGSSIRLKFTEPQFAVTPGQAVVFYEEDTVIGGGTIERNKT